MIKQGAYHTGVLTHVDTVPAIGGEVQVGSYLGRGTSAWYLFINR